MEAISSGAAASSLPSLRIQNSVTTNARSTFKQLNFCPISRFNLPTRSFSTRSGASSYAAKKPLTAADLTSEEKSEWHADEWAFCHAMFKKIDRHFAFTAMQLDTTEIRDAVCIFFLVLRALDTIEDDTSITTKVKVPILNAFHSYIYDREWHFPCGTMDCKILMDEFHLVSTAFSELGKDYQATIEDIAKRMGAGMAKFICKEVKTIKDYDEYCHYVAGLVGLSLSKLFHASGKESLAPDSLSYSMGLLIQKADIITDYMSDMNELPKPRMFWPREIWNKYVNKLEDLKYEENSVEAVQCLNDMVTNALTHVDDCLNYLCAIRDPSILRFWATLETAAFANLALCYNNVDVFRGGVEITPDIAAKVINETRTMADVYAAFYHLSCMIKSKVEESDPNAMETLSIVEAIQATCNESGLLLSKRDRASYSYSLDSNNQHSSTAATSSPTAFK